MIKAVITATVFALLPVLGFASWDDTAKKEGVLLEAPDDIVLDADSVFTHTRDTDLAISDEEGRQLYFEGLLPMLESKEAFSEATKEARVLAEDYPYIRNAPCAWTVTSGMRWAATKATVLEVRHALPLMKGKQPTHTCTGEDEHTLKRLGFHYFSKNTYIAPKGSVGLLNDRSPATCNIPSNLKSGHIYFIMKDGGPRGYKDNISDNLGRFNIIYKGPGADAGTHGFWLPPGVYPTKR
jgi:hypothetical protein